MRKAQKQRAEELVRQMEEAHDQLKKYIEQGSIPSAMELLEECQNGGITLGTLIEGTEGEGHPTVSLLEEYCELSYQVHEQLAEKKEINANKIYKLLRQKLIRISNSLKNDVRVRLEIAFFPYKASMWDSLESVYLAAKEDPDCDAYCVPIPYYDLNPDRSFGQMHYEGNVRPDGTPIEYPEEIEITDWQEYNFEERRPDVIFIHNPYDNCNLVTSVHPRYYSGNLRQYTETLVYIPYYVTSGGMLAAQGMLPSYLNVDYIVIQSPKFREQFDKNIPDEKFLPFGSPKVDKVINKCKNPPEPPKEWKEKMIDQEGRRKRIIFYNTGISAMLYDTETFFEKMQYVFQCAEKHEDICILWRPHPLLETTFHSMRSEYKQRFVELKKYFVEKEVGILDTTADIEDSIALSDAYIGDAGTSVIALFGVAGKPVFILNNKVGRSLESEPWREEINVGSNFNYLEQNRFIITQGNKLYISEGERYDYHYFCTLSDSVNKAEYFIIWQIDGKKYACPAGGQSILKIGNGGIEKKISLKRECVAGQEFSDAWKYNRYLILMPLYYPAIVRIDTTTEECAYFRDGMDVLIKDKAGQRITGGSLIYRGVLYMASPVDNVVCKFDIENGKAQLITIPLKSRCGCYMLAEFMDQIWILPQEGKVIARWNPQTGETKEYMGFPENFICVDPRTNQKCDQFPFSSIAFHGDDAYLTPRWGNMYLRFNIHTEQFARWEPPFENEEEDNKVIWNKGFFLQSKSENQGDWFKIYSNIQKRLYHVNLKTNEFEEIKITFDIKDLEEHEKGFDKYSETLIYACVENAFNSLDRLFDGMMVGSPFNRDKQLETYRKIMANVDGSCGRNVYKYIKEKG